MIILFVLGIVFINKLLVASHIKYETDLDKTKSKNRKSTEYTILSLCEKQRNMPFQQANTQQFSGDVQQGAYWANSDLFPN